KAPAGIAQSPLWGLGRTLALEHPDLWGGLIDLPIEADVPEAAARLLEELKTGDEEDQIALRSGKRLAARLVRAIGKTPPRCRLRSDATYWIVGGLGSVGFKTAEALVNAGAKHLVLTGRHAANEPAALNDLRGRAEIAVLPSDVASEADIGAVLT